MTDAPSDQAARERFASDWDTNLAIVANAGSGKTTAISHRLARMALTPRGTQLLERTAVVTFAKKAATQIERRARAVLAGQAAERGAPGDPLAPLDRVFFGTIHSFCIRLARQHGSAVGVHLNPTLVEEEDEGPWEEFLAQDPMEFEALSQAQIGAFLRHAALDDVFDLARSLNHADALRLRGARVAQAPEPPRPSALDAIRAAVSPRGRGAEALARNKEAAERWVEAFERGSGRLPLPQPEGTAGGIVALFAALVRPLKDWLAAAGGVMAGELSLRYLQWRQERGIQTFEDQVDTALAVLGDSVMLDRIRAEGWRILLDEAQDTDASQFAVLVEIARPPGARPGTWPGSGPAPRPGHFCLVGDAQQGIYSSRADIRNFQRHVDAFGAGDGGERLTFDVTFRVPCRVIRTLNDTLPAAFGPGHDYNLGLPPEPGAPEPRLQVGYERLAPGPANPEGAASVLSLPALGIGGRSKVADRRLAAEARAVARLLRERGPGAVGAARWGDICFIAPRRSWLLVIRDALESEHLQTALQMRRNRSGDNPAYAWLCGLMAVVCDPDNTFEWAGVLREVFAVSDADIAAALRSPGAFRWDEPEGHTGDVQGAMRTLRPFVERVDAAGASLGRFAADLVRECGLAWKARAADPEGGLEDELARLVAGADSLGVDGGGPRQWLRALLEGSERLRALGSPSPEAINLITVHSAKGLEWPVVILPGLWRRLRRVESRGLRVVDDRQGSLRVVFDAQAMGDDAKESRAREWRREQVRLLYVALTRAKASLVVPWAEDAAPEDDSLASFWGFEPGWLDQPASAEAPAFEAPEPPLCVEDVPAPVLEPVADRVLPHKLASGQDRVRDALHEAADGDPAPGRDAVDPLDYGTWWHEMMEGLAWGAAPGAVESHAADCLARAADKGFRDRGEREWLLFKSSGAWGRLRDDRWEALAEAGILAPLGPGRWMDGVADLVLHDGSRSEVWVVDWKTNRKAAAETQAEFLGRLAGEYAPQVRAYGACVASFFPGCTVRLWLYGTAVGAWIEVPAG